MALQVQFEITGNAGGPWLSTMHFSGTTLTNAQNAADAVRAFWVELQGAIHESLDGRIVPEVVIINDLTSEPTGLFTVTPGDPVSFTSGAAMLPVASQALVRWRTGVYDGGREIRGRTFIPGITTVNNNSGVPASGLLAALTTAAGNLVSDADSELTVYSRTKRVNAVVIGGTPWTEFATLRSRRD